MRVNGFSARSLLCMRLCVWKCRITREKRTHSHKLRNKANNKKNIVKFFTISDKPYL